jgi:hypothetical protein
MTRASPPASSAPAGGPNSSAAAIVKVSDRDRLMGNPGIRMVAHPVTSVSSARTNSIIGNGSASSRITENASTAPPAAMIVTRYADLVRLAPDGDAPGFSTATDSASSMPCAHVIAFYWLS